jgi:hypothetical protein
MTLLGALSSFRKRREMSPHKRACRPKEFSGFRITAKARIVRLECEL